MVQGEARSRSVLMGLDNHVITGAVPALLLGPSTGHDATSWTRHMNRTDPLHAVPLPMADAPDGCQYSSARRSVIYWFESRRLTIALKNALIAER